MKNINKKEIFLKSWKIIDEKSVSTFLYDS